MSRISGNVARRNASRVRARDLSLRSPKQVTGATDKQDAGDAADRGGMAQAAGAAPRLFDSELLYQHPEILLAVVRTILRGGAVSYYRCQEEAGKPASFVRREDVARELTGGFHVGSGLLGSVFFSKGVLVGRLKSCGRVWQVENFAGDGGDA